jgi:LemA protein
MRFLGIAVLAIIGLGVGCGVVSYNKLNSLEQNVQAQWAEVQSSYQRRADLIPNLVETVKGAAAFEKDTMIAVTEARARAGQVNAGASAPSNPAQFQQFQQAQDALSSSLSRLLVVVEKSPDLKRS